MQVIRQQRRMEQRPSKEGEMGEKGEIESVPKDREKEHSRREIHK